MALSKDDSTVLTDIMKRLGFEGAEELTTKEDVEKLIKASVKAEDKSPKKGKRKSSMGFEDDEEEDEEDKPTLSNNVPKLTWFNGELPLVKGHASYEMWNFEVEGLHNVYCEAAIIQAMKRSLKGKAADAIRCLGYDVSCDDIIETLDTRWTCRRNRSDYARIAQC